MTKAPASAPTFEQMPHLLHGVDWGRHKVLAKNANGVMLVWLSGGSVWSGMGGTHHCPSDLRIVYTDLTQHGNRKMGRIINSGGRLSKARIEAASEQIDSVFGAGAAKSLTLKSTVHFDDCFVPV